jgi:hypothetical protein
LAVGGAGVSQVARASGPIREAAAAAAGQLYKATVLRPPARAVVCQEHRDCRELCVATYGYSPVSVCCSVRVEGWVPGCVLDVACHALARVQTLCHRRGVCISVLCIFWWECEHV